MLKTVNLTDKFNQTSLHAPDRDILNLYKDISEITEIDDSGHTITRPLFSHSDMGSFLNLESVSIDNFKWDRPFIYSVILHHHIALAAKHLNIIPEKIQQEIRKENCKLILDDLMEGDNPSNFFKEIHISIEKLKLKGKQIYYITNNLYAEDVYKQWCRKFNPKQKINVISFPYDIFKVRFLKKRNHLPKTVNIDELIRYRENNIENMRTFLQVNRTTRPERNLYMLFINKHNLYNKFKLSFHKYNTDYKFTEHVSELFKDILEKENIENLIPKVPFDIDETDKTNHGPPGFKPGYFNADLPYNPVHYIDTFISTVMCAFPFVENACHLHDSTYNPIYCGHPVIQFGPYRHLQKLKELGFKTFDRWWDESYDNIEDGWDRLIAVFDIVKQISKLSNKDLLKMNREMKDILIHNSELINNFDVEKHLVKRIFDETVL